MNQHPVFLKYKRTWLHEVTGFSLNYLCRIATGRAPLTRSFIERVCHKLKQPEEALFLCLQPGNCAATAIGQWLESKGKAESLSIRQMATKAGVSHQTIAGLINGTSPSIETIKKLARSFGEGHQQTLSLEDELFALAGYRTPHTEGNRPNQAFAEVMDKISNFNDPQLKIMARFADFLIEMGN